MVGAILNFVFCDKEGKTMSRGGGFLAVITVLTPCVQTLLVELHVQCRVCSPTVVALISNNQQLILCFQP